MSDIYEALIGEGAGQKSALLAQLLRRRNEMGQLGQITGDKVLSGVGQGLTKEVGNQTEALQQIRQFGVGAGQRDQQLQQTQDYQTGQLDHMRNTLAETKRANDLEHEYRMLMAEAAGIRANKTGTGGKIPKLRQGDIKELQDLSATIGTIDGMEQYLAGGGKFGAKEFLGTPVPGSRGLANTMASYGIGKKEDLEAFAKKQEWSRMYDLAERNRLFGATLTPNEQKSWKEANPSVSMTDAQIAAALPIMRKVFQHRLDRKVSGLTKEGYNAEAMADYADVPGVNTPLAPMDGAQAPQGTKRVKVDAQGNVIGN